MITNYDEKPATSKVSDAPSASVGTGFDAHNWEGDDIFGEMDSEGNIVPPGYPDSISAPEDSTQSVDPLEDSDPFGTSMASEYDLDSYMDDTDVPDDPMRVSRLRVSDDYPSNLLKFAHLKLGYRSHRLKGPGDPFEKFYQCNGDGCPACAASIKGAVDVAIECFFDLDSRAFVAYVAQVSRKRGSFSYKLRRACQGQIPCVLRVHRAEGQGYMFDRAEAHSFDLKSYAQRVADFRAALERGEVDLEEVLPVLDNDEMMEIPAIRNNLPLS